MKRNNDIYYLITGIILCCSISCSPNNTYAHTAKIKHRKTYVNKKRIKHDKNKIITHVNLTCYQPVRSQCNSDPLTTSDGSKINLKHLKHGAIKWCAISRDLLYLFRGKKDKIIYIEGYGVYEVHDVMNSRYTHHIDILQHPSNSRLIQKKNVKVVIY